MSSEESKPSRRFLIQMPGAPGSNALGTTKATTETLLFMSLKATELRGDDETRNSAGKTYGFEYWYIDCTSQTDVAELDETTPAWVALSLPTDRDAAHGSEDKNAPFQKWLNDPSRPKENVIVVDTSKSPDDCLKQILKAIGPRE
ncbi:uncharacterized protein N0V96_009086 [Colletotrichum fioriniae]|uniref:uncharacterized protein n=1 Tax=Colletotrichum fioriniae TaxID=710243 RepID=UPI0032DAD341|nr:hypothetical protein N0V96_009086 [Colletotrichum fioriniae]